MDNKISVSFIYKVVSWIKGKIFWKNSRIIYINSNKKKFNQSDIDANCSTRKAAWLVCESNMKLGYKFYRIHFIKMKKKLYDITRNCDDNCDLTYAGFSSPLFAAYDGYVIGDNRNYTFIDIDSNNSKPYRINYKKNYKKINVEKIADNEINIVYACSFDVNMDLINNNKTFVFDQKSGSKVNKEYLNQIYDFTKSILDEANECGVRNVNMYICAKQPISFVIGSAIQIYHPTTRIYEYSQGKYTDCINIQKGRLEGKEW